MAPPESPVRPERLHRLNSREASGRGPVLYWMSRDQRAVDNWALFHAQQEALWRGTALVTVFCLAPAFLGAALRQYEFMLEGLRGTERELRRLRIAFVLLTGDPGREIPAFAARAGASLVVTDFDPLRVKMEWRKAAAAGLDVPLVEVDAHNIVPARHASPKQEFGAYTLRPKLNRLLEGFLVPIPPVVEHPRGWAGAPSAVDWDGAKRALKADASVGAVSWIAPGAPAGLRMMRGFIGGKLREYPSAGRDPTVDGLSNISPYLHFGQISAQRVALEVMGSGAGEEAKGSFLEELIVRRELSDNFCLHNHGYDSVNCFPAWAARTLVEHAGDVRGPLYSRDRLESADTHDELWNAAQRQMALKGKMHGYLGTYLANKILEWTASPAEALGTVIFLKDRYELDDRDPDG